MSRRKNECDLWLLGLLYRVSTCLASRGTTCTLIVLRKTIPVHSGVIMSWWFTIEAYRENPPPPFLPVQILNFITRPHLPTSDTSWCIILGKKIFGMGVSDLFCKFTSHEESLNIVPLESPLILGGGRSILRHVDRLTSQCQAMENPSGLPEFKIYQRSQQGNSILRQTFISSLLKILQHWRQFAPVLFYTHYKVSIAVI